MDTPGPAPKVTPEDALGVFERQTQPGTPLTATEVADELDCSRRTAHRKLETLVERGDVNSKKTGARGRVWWRPLDAMRSPVAGSADRFEPEQFGAFVSEVEDYAIFMLDPDGVVVNWNEGAERIKGYREEEIVGEHFSTFYTRAAVERGVPERNLETAAARGRCEDEGWRVRADGSQFWADVVITAIRDEEGTLRGFTKVTRDLTERRERERTLRRERDFVEKVLETVPVSIGVLTADGEFERANSRMLDRLGIGPSDLDRFPVDACDLYDEAGEPIPPDDWPWSTVTETREPVHGYECQVDVPERGRRWISINAAPLGDGQDDRVVVAVDDVTDRKERERELERRKSELETELGEILGRVSDAFYALDEEWRFTHVNERAEEILGRSEAELLGERVWEALPEMSDTLVREEYRRAMEDQEPVSFETHFEASGTWEEITAYPSETGLSVYFQDVTERVRRERELAKSRLRYRVLVENFPNGAVALVDDDLRYTTVGGDPINNARVDELVEEPIEDVLSPELADVLVPRYEAAFAGESSSFEHEYDGRVYQFRVLPVRDDDGEVFAAMGMSQDVTGRKDYERRLEEQREQYRRLVDVAPVSIAIYDADGEVRFGNAAAAELANVGDPEDLIGEDALDFIHPDDRDEAVERMRTVIGDREPVPPKETRFVAADGETRHTIITSVPITYEGDPAAQVVLTDITEQKERERELERFRTIVRTVNDGVYTVDEAGRFTMVNDSYAEMTGYSREALVGSHVSTVVDEETVETARALEREMIVGDRDRGKMEADLETADGGTVRAEATFAVLPTDDATDERVGVVRDITERKEYERELETRARQQEVVSELGQSALENPPLDELFDEAVEAVADTLDNDFCKVLDLCPDGEELLLRAGVGWTAGLVGEATVGTGLDSQAGYTLRSEEPVVVEDLRTEERFSGPALLTEHGVVSGISTIIGPYDDPWGVLGTHDTAHCDVHEHDVNFVQSVANILSTAIKRKQYERHLDETIEKLGESNERLEQFAYVASHDLQEPLRMVSNYLQLLDGRYGDRLDDDGEEFLEYAVDGAERMREMIADLLAYSRVDTRAEPLEATDTAAVLDRVRKQLELQIRENDAEVVVGDLPTVPADANQLEQVFQNLLSNAIKYRGDDPPRIEIDAEERADEWEFRVADNGIGIDPDHVDRIFEVFRRLHTHEEYPGTGIGLALCRKIVERHGGEIWVDAAPGEGSTFYFTVPKEDQA